VQSAGDILDPHHFTGKERDTETGNDYFGARYYSSLAGRFLTPDWSAKVEPVPYAKVANPQSLNLYAYVDNNPLSGIDVDGHSGIFSSLAALWSAISGNEGGKNESGTEEFAAVNFGQGAQQQDATAQQSQAVLDNAKKYTGTRYQMGGHDHSGIDCSNLVCNAANSAGFPFKETEANSLPKDTKNFRALRVGEKPRRGDLAVWVHKVGHGHVAIYDASPSKDGNNFLSATVHGGVREGPSSWFGGAPTVYLRLRVPTQ
jgi:RHS repeat-associated protein